MARSARVRQRTIVAVAGLSAVLALAACGGDGGGSTASGEDSFKVGFVLQLSGPGSVYADTAQAGHKAAVADVNSGGKAGRKLVSEVADAGGDPASATTACNRLVQQTKVQALIVFVPGPQLLACNTLAARQNVPVLSLSSGAGNICAPNLTSFGLVPNQQTLPVIDQLLTQGKKKWYFFGGDYATPKATIALAKQYVTDHGGTVVGESYEPTGTADFSQDITAMVNARPDAAFLNVIGNDDVALQKQWAADPRTKGITRVDILLGEGAAHALGPAADGIWSSSVYFSSITDSGNEGFRTAVKAAGLDAPPDVNAYVSYLQVQALAAAVKQAGPKGPDVINALRATKVDAPVGPFEIHDAFSFQTEYLAQAQSDGSFVLRGKSDPIEPKLACKR